jgi:zinc transport system substrate-binding protein
MKKNITILIIVFLVVIGILFINSSLQKNKKEENNKISIVTTLFPLYDFAQEIGSDKVTVNLLLPPGMEPHSFEPKPSDIVKINESNIFIYTGNFMEPWAEDVIKSISNKNVIVVDSSQNIELAKEDHEHEDEHTSEKEESDHKHNKVDPHIWLNFDNSKIIIDNIVTTLIKKDPTNADFYQKNATEYKEKLTQLDNKFKSTLSNCEKKEIIYSGHYAFGYLSKKYNLAYESAYGISPNSEPSAQNLIKLVEQIKKEQTKFIFTEELLSQKVAETLAQETGTSILLLNPAGNLSKEAFEKKKTFLAIMEENLDNLKIGLLCK